MILDEIIFGK